MQECSTEWASGTGEQLLNLQVKAEESLN